MVARRRRSPPLRRDSWLRDRDLLVAYVMRGLIIAVIAVAGWIFNREIGTVDELAKEVPILSNTTAALAKQLDGEQTQIHEIWGKLFDGNKKK